jgi:hypothetical protein
VGTLGHALTFQSLANLALANNNYTNWRGARKPPPNHTVTVSRLGIVFQPSQRNTTRDPVLPKRLSGLLQIYSRQPNEARRCYPEGTMVSVRFARRTLALALPWASDFAPTGYPGLTNRLKWQRGTPKISYSTKFRHDSEYILKTPPRNNGEISSHQSALEYFSMVGKVLLTCV